MNLRDIRRSALLFMLLFVGTFMLCNNVKAVDSFPSKISVNIDETPDGSYLLSYGGKRLFYKGYTSTSPKGEGRAFCSSFALPAPGQYPWLKAHSCKEDKFSGNSATNERVAASIGAIAKLARSTTGLKNSSIHQRYYYAEIAINQFLYNGYKNKKGFGNVYNNTGSVTDNSDGLLKKYLAAGNYEYNNFKNTKVTFSSIKYVDNTVEANIKCTDYAGKNKSCSLTDPKAKVVIDGATQTLAAKVSGNKVTVDLNSLISNLSTDSKHTVKTTIYVNDKVTYNSVQNYDCGTNSAGQKLQSMIPNMLKPGSYTVSANKAVTKTIPVKDVIEPTGGFNILKYDSDTGNFLNDSVVEIYQDNELILTEEIPANSYGLQIENLPYGNYCIKEVNVKSGYKLDKYTVDGVTVTPDDNGVCVQIKDGKTSAAINVYNKKDITTIKVNKLDVDGNPVKGAKLRVFYTEVTETTNSESGETDNDYKIVDVVSWETDGNAKTIEVEVGKTYTVVEDVPPENYTPVTNVVEITASADAGKNVVTLTNVYSSFKISKQDITNKKELPGAKLEIRDERGLLMASWVSTDKPQEITGLDDGNYTLTETTAPNGYSISETISFTIENGKLKDDADNVLVMYDKLIVKVPDTFSTKNIITMLIGLIMVGSGIGVLVYEFKKKKTA